MSLSKITISGTGCALADFLYTGISFHSAGFNQYLSRTEGDGGLSPGKLVFTEELEKFSGNSYTKILNDIVGNKTPDSFNVGGPSLVPLIHVSQMLDSSEFKVRYYGMSSKDDIATRIKNIARKTSLDITNYHSSSDKHTPFTDVLSDPDYENGHGERTFINNIGAAWDYYPEYLDQSFYDSNIVCFGGTALVPNIHDNLTFLLKEADRKNCITVVNTVYDFRNEKRYPGKPWPLVDKIDDYKFIDLLIMDCDEALKISGEKSVEIAASFFSSTQVGSFLITNGVNDFYAWSSGGLFEQCKLMLMPVSKKVTSLIYSDSTLLGDTTGCGDNFAGGVIASVSNQLKIKYPGRLNFFEAISWGVASGGLSCFTVGGTYLEQKKGEKKQKVLSLINEYLKQIDYVK